MQNDQLYTGVATRKQRTAKKQSLRLDRSSILGYNERTNEPKNKKNKIKNGYKNILVLHVILFGITCIVGGPKMSYFFGHAQKYGGRDPQVENR